MITLNLPGKKKETFFNFCLFQHHEVKSFETFLKTQAKTKILKKKKKIFVILPIFQVHYNT